MRYSNKTSGQVAAGFEDHELDLIASKQKSSAECTSKNKIDLDELSSSSLADSDKDLLHFHHRWVQIR